MAAIGHCQSYLAGKLEPAQAIVQRGRKSPVKSSRPAAKPQTGFNSPERTNSVTSISSEHWLGWTVAPMLTSCSAVSSILNLVGIEISPPSASSRVQGHRPYRRARTARINARLSWLAKLHARKYW